MKRTNVPTVLVIFGATGDLMARKIVPALFHLHSKKMLPQLFSVVGVARRPLPDSAFREHVAQSLKQHFPKMPKPNQQAFLALFGYHAGTFNQASLYGTLSERLGRVDNEWNVCANKLFYLAVPPEHYGTIFRNLAKSGLTKPCSPEEGWTRVLVEKPFGKNTASANKLEKLLSSLFKEIQIYRIDHYLAKEMLQNIINFRFSNNLFEGQWNSRVIEKIDILLHETIGVESRGPFYDGLGALRDVGQNHLLQMLALVTMDRPSSLTAHEIRGQRAKLLGTLHRLNRAEVATNTRRGQYQGYRAVKGVSPRSQTETYFRVKTLIDSPRWAGVPITLESGKRMGTVRKEIVVEFKHTTPCLCPAGRHFKNRVIFTLEPKETIKIQFWTKKPGFDYQLQEREFNFFLYQKRQKIQYVEEYAKLLADSIAGDQTLFLSTQEVAVMWRFIDPIIKAWNAGVMPLKAYQADSSEIARAATAGAPSQPSSPKELAIVGLGKMGANLAENLLEKGYHVIGFNRTSSVTGALQAAGLDGAYSLQELVAKLSPPKVIWLALPAGDLIDEILFGASGLAALLRRGDIVIDAGNTFYKDSLARHKKLAKLGVHFLDVGISGGPSGARFGASLMVGGNRAIFNQVSQLLNDIAVPEGVAFFGLSGAGHFVKMIHNGIEYGMMQAIAEGFTILKKSDYHLDLSAVASVYGHGSVIESRLIDWLHQAFSLHGENLRGVSGAVAHTGEAQWTIEAAKQLDVRTKVIAEALNFRKLSQTNPSYTGKIVSALREQFGGHTTIAR